VALCGWEGPEALAAGAWCRWARSQERTSEAKYRSRHYVVKHILHVVFAATADPYICFTSRYLLKRQVLGSGCQPVN
jgi:hypothetical protein